MKVIDALVLTKLCKSKTEARKLIKQGGAKIQDMKVTDINADIFTHKNRVILVQNNGIQVKDLINRKNFNVSKRGKST